MGKVGRSPMMGKDFLAIDSFMSYYIMLYHSQHITIF
jgi:hypothetical protein